MRKKFIFSHIPKTAGTSIKGLLQANYPKTRRLSCYPSPTERHKSVADKMPFLDVIASHSEFGCHKTFDWPANYFSFLRHPVDQVVSNFSHLKWKSFGHEMPHHMSLDDFLNSDDGNNLQTVYFSGITQTDARFKEDPQQVLNIAKRNMDNFYFFVGITEQYNESAFMLSKLLQWRVLKIERRNVNTKTRPANTSRETRELIEKKCSLDMDLYAYGKKRFDEAFVPFRDEFTRLKPGRSNFVLHSNHVKNFVISSLDSIQSKCRNITCRKETSRKILTQISDAHSE